MINQVVKGAMTYLKRPFILKFDENEPKVYKLQVVRGNVIKEDAIVAYAAQAASVPESTIIMAKNALFDAINYFCANGRRVMVPNLGSFAPVTRCKVARNEADCDTRTIKKHGRVLRFWPSGAVGASGSGANITLKEAVALSNMACGAMDGVDANNNTYLVNSEGKYLVAQINAEGAYKRFKKNGNVYELVAGSGTGGKKGADEVAVVGTMTDQDDGVFTVGSTQYTMNSGALIPEANVYGSLDHT